MVELLFLTHDRLEFTEQALSAMLANTDWDRVSKIWLFDDRSIDGTLEAVREFAASAPVPAEIVSGTWDSPVDTMASFFARTTSPLVAKIDNDVILPPGWLKECVGLMARHPEVDLLGIEAGGQSSAGAAPFGAERVPDAGGIDRWHWRIPILGSGTGAGAF
jgi:cellulose synthase/poly-beta-1,6-N-acetylglucosamine synthase-like glycosyltransferase